VSLHAAELPLPITTYSRSLHEASVTIYFVLAVWSLLSLEALSKCFHKSIPLQKTTTNKQTKTNSPKLIEQK
jgi:hypothetical protein